MKVESFVRSRKFGKKCQWKLSLLSFCSTKLPFSKTTRTAAKFYFGEINQKSQAFLFIWWNFVISNLMLWKVGFVILTFEHLSACPHFSFLILEIVSFLYDDILWFPDWSSCEKGDLSSWHLNISICQHVSFSAFLSWKLWVFYLMTFCDFQIGLAVKRVICHLDIWAFAFTASHYQWLLSYLEDR